MMSVMIRNSAGMILHPVLSPVLPVVLLVLPELLVEDLAGLVHKLPHLLYHLCELWVSLQITQIFLQTGQRSFDRVSLVASVISLAVRIDVIF